jgi:hypothetical protein
MKTAEWNALSTIISQTARFGNSSRTATARGGGEVDITLQLEKGRFWFLSFSLFLRSAI